MTKINIYVNGEKIGESDLKNCVTFTAHDNRTWTYKLKRFIKRLFK